MELEKLLRHISRKREEDHPFPEQMDHFLDDFIPNALLKSETLQIAFDITEEEMETVYAEGYEYYQSECFSQSCNVFRWLVILNPFQLKYWLGLGASQQLLLDYDKALHSYAVAAFLDTQDPAPHFHAYQCYDQLSIPEEAKKALLLAHQKASKNQVHQNLRQEIETILWEHYECSHC